MYQPVTVVTPQGQVVTQALSPGTIRIQNSQVRVSFPRAGLGLRGATWGTWVPAGAVLGLKTSVSAGFPVAVCRSPRCQRAVSRLPFVCVIVKKSASPESLRKPEKSQP